MSEFYKKEERTDSRCKSCVKKKRTKKYAMKKIDYETHKCNRITGVIEKNRKEEKLKLIRDIETLSLILENFIYRLMIDKRFA